MSVATVAKPPTIRDLLSSGSRVLSHYDVARATGFHPSYITRIFNGDRRPSLDCAAAVAGYLGVSIDTLTAVLHRVRKGK